LAIPSIRTHAVASRCSRNHEPSSADPWHIPPKELEGAAESVIATVFEVGGFSPSQENLSGAHEFGGSASKLPSQSGGKRVGDSVIALLVAEEDSDAVFAA